VTDVSRQAVGSKMSVLSDQSTLHNVQKSTDVIYIMAEAWNYAQRNCTFHRNDAPCMWAAHHLPI